MKQKEIVDILLTYSEKNKTNKFPNICFTTNKEANELILNNSNAFLFAVILDERIEAERAWEGPYLLKKRLGHIDPKKIMMIETNKLVEICKIKPEIHFEYNKSAIRIKNASELLIKKYDGIAKNIWSNEPRTYDLFNRFKEFDGIGQKKASMAVNILVRDFGISAIGKKWIDISNDGHVQRVFYRVGLVDVVDQKKIIETARNLYPEYPGALDLPTWLIGRNFCFPTKPNCKECPLKSCCLKVGVKKIITYDRP